MIELQSDAGVTGWDIRLECMMPSHAAKDPRQRPTDRLSREAGALHAEEHYGVVPQGSGMSPEPQRATAYGRSSCLSLRCLGNGWRLNGVTFRQSIGVVRP